MFNDFLLTLKGAGIAASPLVASILGTVHEVASFIAVVSGAIIGVVGVIRIIRNKKSPTNSPRSE